MVPWVLAGLLDHPGLVLSALRQRHPVVRDGRVLDRGVQAMLAVTRLAGSPRYPQVPADLVAMRARLRRSSRMAMPIRTDIGVSDQTIPGVGETPAIRVRVYRPANRVPEGGPPAPYLPPAVVYFHGGGWIKGDLDTHDATCRLTAANSGCVVVAVGYRLAPEHPFPAAVEDCVAAYAWVHQNAGPLGVEPGRVGVMGDSAGGSLAAAVARLASPPARSPVSDVPTPVAQCLVYPALDARLQTDSVYSLGHGFLLTRASLEIYRRLYLPDRSDWTDPRASPLLATDFAGLPPALVVTAGFDPLRDEGADYAAALEKGGVPVEYRCYDDQVHGFMGMGILRHSLAITTEVAEAMGQLMRQPPSTVGR